MTPVNRKRSSSSLGTPGTLMQRKNASQTSDGDEAVPPLQVSQRCGGVGGDGLDADVHHVPFGGRNMPESHPDAATRSLDDLRLNHKQTV